MSDELRVRPHAECLQAAARLGRPGPPPCGTAPSLAPRPFRDRRCSPAITLLWGRLVSLGARRPEELM